MLIEESISISADLNTVWDIFTDLTRWRRWNTALTDVSATMDRIAQGLKLSVNVRLFPIPIRTEVRIVEVVPRERVAWSSSKYGISSRHEFQFGEQGAFVRVSSRETFSGLPLLLAPFTFPAGRIRNLTLLLLKDLKQAVETDALSHEKKRT
jgi:hypothetical protein